jgi:hypothetical protein
MPRKRKRATDWAKEFSDDLETREKKRNTENDSETTLVCRYCSVEIDVDPKKKPWDRIKEHLASSRHKRLKENYKKRIDANKQLTLFETEVRQRKKEKEAESATHDFVRALSYSAISLNHADGFLGKLFKRYCPAARCMPTRRQLEQKYLPEVYAQHKELIKQKINNRKLSIISDESPEVLGRPAVNTLFCYHNKEKNTKEVVLADTSILRAVNSTSLSVLLSKVLGEYGKGFRDVMAISSDSAEYLSKLVRDLQMSYNQKLLHIKDIPHLIHVAIDFAIQSKAMADIRQVVIKFGAIFKHAAKLERLFYQICQGNGLSDEETCKPPAVVPTRWFSFYHSATITRRMWQHLLTFIDSPQCQGENANALKTLLGDDKHRQFLLIKLVFLLENLGPVHEIQKELESGDPMLHRMYHKVNVQLQTEIATKASEDISLGTETTTLLSVLSASDARILKNTLIDFNQTLARKWQATCERNLNPDVCGSEGIWKKAIVLDPFLKPSQSQSFSNYLSMFEIVEDDHTVLESEFNNYLHEPCPENPEIKILTYWKGVTQLYPKLSDAALQLLSLPNGSADVERSFSKLRKLQDPTRARMNESTLCMQMTLYVNQELEERFIGF